MVDDISTQNSILDTRNTLGLLHYRNLTEYIIHFILLRLYHYIRSTISIALDRLEYCRDCTI